MSIGDHAEKVGQTNAPRAEDRKNGFTIDDVNETV